MLDVEKLIECVQKRPALYDVRSKEYNNRQIKTRCWTEVGEEMHDDWGELTASQRTLRGKLIMKKWKALRDNFVRDYKVLIEVGALKKKKYLYYDQLQFLAPHLKLGEKSTNTTMSETEEDNGEERVLSSVWDELSCSDPGNDPQLVEIKLEPDGYDDCVLPETLINVNKKLAVHQIPETPPTNQLQVPKCLNQPIQETTQKDECGTDSFGNKAFLLSYLPIMDGLPQQAQLHARMLITQVFYGLQSQPQVITALK